ncbi:MAG: DUF1028 domain-containing protein [Bacteroidota bacterium]
MKTIITVILLLLLFNFCQAQDTFSIVAVDSLTGEIGAAGASCVDAAIVGTGVIVINEIQPNRGAINSQASLNFINQRNAGTRMRSGNSPEEIIDWLKRNDVQRNASIRQYGIVDFDDNGSPRSAAFTGPNCFDYKGQRLGKNYAIQGNILKGAAILDSMEARFLRASGTLADQLMEAMQGANVAGADIRCLGESVSSLSAFIRVAKPDDTPDNFWLEIDVKSTPFGVEPIDVLQEQYEEWKSTVSTSKLTKSISEIYPNPIEGQLFIKLEEEWSNRQLRIFIYNTIGQQIYARNSDGQTNFRIQESIFEQSGLYVVTVVSSTGEVLETKKLIK